jgi:hypothetical protein
VQPLPITTGAVGEATEGKLVRITGKITQPIVNDLPFGFIIVVNDGSSEVNSFVNASTGIDVSGISLGQTIEVTGFSGQFADHFEVDPRVQGDIKVVRHKNSVAGKDLEKQCGQAYLEYKSMRWERAWGTSNQTHAAEAAKRVSQRP